jgi:hypothetical protein
MRRSQTDSANSAENGPPRECCSQAALKTTPTRIETVSDNAIPMTAVIRQRESWLAPHIDDEFARRERLACLVKAGDLALHGNRVFAIGK